MPGLQGPALKAAPSQHPTQPHLGISGGFIMRMKFPEHVLCQLVYGLCGEQHRISSAPLIMESHERSHHGG